MRTADRLDALSLPETRIDFADYLEAKFALDERSLNDDVRRACFESLGARPVVRCLDIGAGTGAMVRRLTESGLAPSLAITAIDCEAQLLAIARRDLLERLAHLGFRVRAEAGRIDANDANGTVQIELVHRSLFDFEPSLHVRYDLVTAHSFMDLVPLGRTLSCISRRLADGGLLYATLNYDGDTALFPVYRDPAFERAVLASYHASMEQRRVEGEPTGGAQCGRRLHALLLESGFDVVAYGSSDWKITPFHGGYRGRDADVLRMLLGCIHDESEREPTIDRTRLACWYAERSAHLASGELGMIVHHIDMLARRCQGRRAFT